MNANQLMVKIDMDANDWKNLFLKALEQNRILKEREEKYLKTISEPSENTKSTSGQQIIPSDGLLKSTDSTVKDLDESFDDLDSHSQYSSEDLSNSDSDSSESEVNHVIQSLYQKVRESKKISKHVSKMVSEDIRPVG